MSGQTESGFNIKFGVGKDGSNESRKLLKNFLHFEYMGSAEFEFGAIPSWFVDMAKKASVGNLDRWIVYYGKEKFYVIGQSDLKEEITEQIELLILDQYRLKERSRIDEYLERNQYCKTTGWICLDNPYMFSVDERIINYMCTFWGIAKSKVKVG